MDRATGEPTTDELADIRQSVADILTTPIGSRIARRDYGSLLPLLVDAPLVDATLLRAYSATIIAVLTWEDRLRVQRIGRSADASQPGGAVLTLDGITSDGAPVTLAVPVAGA